VLICQALQVSESPLPFSGFKCACDEEHICTSVLESNADVKYYRLVFLTAHDIFTGVYQLTPLMRESLTYSF